MSTCVATFLMIVAACSQASDDRKSSPRAPVLCSDSWYRSIEEKVPTGDGQGHGPDIGSDEWKSVVDFKLGVRGKPTVPSRDSWCQYIRKRACRVRAGGPTYLQCQISVGIAAE